jgi:uncharacterized protein (DUF1684 family)
MMTMRRDHHGHKPRTSAALAAAFALSLIPAGCNKAPSAPQQASPASRLAAISAAHQKIDREFKNAQMSPFTAVAYQYFEADAVVRLGVEGTTAVFSGTRPMPAMADLEFDGSGFWVAPVAGSAPPVLLRKTADGNVAADGATVLKGRTRVSAGAVIGLGALYVETFSRANAGGAIAYDPASASRAAFKGLRWFDPDLAFQVDAVFTPNPAPDQIIVGTSRGLTKPYFRVGTFTFSIGGVSGTLMALASSAVPARGDDLFVPFRDATTGGETYEVGRYLNVAFAGAAATHTLDFNLATNPYCAYSAHFNCVIPPRENTLAIQIRAGERRYAEAH